MTRGGHVATTYNQIGADLDRMAMQEPFLINCYRLYDRLLDRFARGPLGRVLDLGCGSGLQTVVLAQRAKEVIGIDIAADLIEIARERCRAFPNVRFLVDDARRLPFQDKAFDAVFAYGDVLSHIVDGYETALSELARVARPGALVSIEVDNKWNLGLLYHPRELWDALRTPGRGHTSRFWEGMPFKTFTHRELRRLLRRYGFEIRGYHAHNILASIIPDKYVLEKHRRSLGGRLALRLGRLDLALSDLYPFNRFGFNIIATLYRL